MYSKTSCSDLFDKQNSERRQLIDVRSPSEFAAGHIPKAINIPLDQVESRIDDIESEIPVVLICQAGVRAELAAKRLGECRDNLAVLDGGTEAWRKQQLPIVRTQSAGWSLERQVRLIAGLLVTIGIAFALLFSRWWIGLSAFVGLGLTFAGLTDICLMGKLLAKMPWNTNKAQTSERAEGRACCSR
jgi:rhodanese-related sulfurtransferase